MLSYYLAVTWIINGTSFTQYAIVNMNELYLEKNPSTPNALSLTVFSVHGNITFQCVVHSTSNVTSTLGTVTATTGMYMYTATVAIFIHS